MAMDFAINESQQAIVENMDRLCARFDDTYWSSSATLVIGGSHPSVIY